MSTNRVLKTIAIVTIITNLILIIIKYTSPFGMDIHKEGIYISICLYVFLISMVVYDKINRDKRKNEDKK